MSLVLVVLGEKLMSLALVNSSIGREVDEFSIGIIEREVDEFSIGKF